MNNNNSTSNVNNKQQEVKKNGFRLRKTRKKVCSFCVEKSNFIDYKDVNKLRKFITERGKILPRRISGACAKHQREVTRAIKLARNIVLLPFTTD
ncbi:ribosomal protein S18 [Candidatus Arthromitus sp. SFB-rat-Yit]|nr:ribosomal protein S18 [Candidatus Arthromitus sp. SFB-rat-Yit]